MLKIDFSQAVTAEAREAEQARLETLTAARALLAKTDWYLVRKVETGAAVPRAILEARKAARDTLSEDGDSSLLSQSAETGVSK